MERTLEIRVIVRRVPLPQPSINALRNLDRYDVVAFTSKNAKTFFMQTLRERRIALPRRLRIIQVGPRADLLKVRLLAAHILFPRSAIAPFDIVRSLRARGNVVRTIPLYTTRGAALSKTEKTALLCGDIQKLHFKSPSGIQGLMGQLTITQKRAVRGIPAVCIGQTTARAARAAGFTNVSIRATL